MCVAIPALIKSIDGQLAQVEIGGITQTANLQLCPQAQVGDYVIVHTGYAINTLDRQEAKETLDLFEAIARVAQEEN
ncbi:MAG TPA: HypC/HybG/HupF family hydrogenase formation chaperone [Candidatus Acetothermia bacterium]|nr:HypC/HybG/HupF family hydrogenase formation chaperone [Candidatus Acetothermia bacterium]